MKTTRIILSALFAGIVGLTNAQYSDGPPPPADNDIVRPSGYFAVGFGMLQPTNSFAYASGTGYGGYALPGYNINLAYAYPIAHSNFGVAVMYNYAWNAYDIDSYVNNIQYSDQNNNYAPAVHDAYAESFILGGLFATIPLDHISFDFRIMGGVALCALPEVDYQEEATSVTASQNFEWDTYGSNSASFASDIGAGIRFKLHRTAIMLGIDYLNADPMVSTTQQYTDQYGNSTYSHVSGSVPISAISYSIGLGYQLR